RWPRRQTRENSGRIHSWWRGVSAAPRSVLVWRRPPRGGPSYPASTNAIDRQARYLNAVREGGQASAAFASSCLPKGKRGCGGSARRLIAGSGIDATAAGLGGHGGFGEHG